MGKYGVYGEYPIVPAYAAAPYPDTLTTVEGAAIWMQYLTAFGALIEYGQTSAQDIVLITAASSDAVKLARGKQYIHDALQSAKLKPVIDRTFTLDAIVEAHRYMESNRQKGKIVVTV